MTTQAASSLPISGAALPPARVGRAPMGMIQSIRTFKHDPLGLFTQLAAAGDIVPFRFLGLPAVFINHPEVARTVLVERHRLYTKNALLLRIVKPLVGESLISSEGDLWRQQRRMMQPAFHRQQIAAWGQVMTEATGTLIDQWLPQAQQGEPIDVMPGVMQLTLRIASRSLFDTHLADQAERFTALFTVANELLASYFTQPFPPLGVPTPRNLRLQATIRHLRRDAAHLLHTRQRDRSIHADLLALLLGAADEHGHGLSEPLLIDNMLTFLFAGHETSAVALAWTLLLLAQHPAIQAQVTAEVDTALAGRVPTMADLANLPATLKVVEEALRLYPPPSFLLRKAERADELHGLRIRSGTLVFICPFTLHRHAAFWPDPERFDPERFTPERVAARTKASYLPFNAGPHQCIGNQFALVELHLSTAMLLQRFEIAQPAGAIVRPEAFLSIRPAGGRLPLHLHPRAAVGRPAAVETVPLDR